MVDVVSLVFWGGVGGGSVLCLCLQILFQGNTHFFFKTFGFLPLPMTRKLVTYIPGYPGFQDIWGAVVVKNGYGNPVYSDRLLFSQEIRRVRVDLPLFSLGISNN